MHLKAFLIISLGYTQCNYVLSSNCLLITGEPPVLPAAHCKGVCSTPTGLQTEEGNFVFLIRNHFCQKQTKMLSAPLPSGQQQAHNSLGVKIKTFTAKLHHISVEGKLTGPLRNMPIFCFLKEKICKE